ncbi:WD40 repeat domain-containing protein [Aliikangiella sp. IMCC44653]
MIHYVQLKKILVVCSLIILSACQPQPESIAAHQHAAQGIFDAAISNDASHAVIASVNFGAAYWDLNNNQLKFLWRHNDDPEKAITAVNLSPDGLRAITASEDTFIIWNTTSGQSYGYWKAPAAIRAVAISNLGRYVLLGLESGLAIHLDMTTGRRLEFTGHRAEAIADVDLSANGLWAFTGGNDYRAVLWNTKTGKPKRLFEHDSRVTTLKLSSDGSKAFTAGTKANAFIWDLSTGALLSQLKLKPREYVITAARFSHNQQYVATGAPSRKINLWQIETGERLKQWRATTRDVSKPVGAIIYDLAFTPNDQILYSESSAGFGESWAIPNRTQ